MIIIIVIIVVIIIIIIIISKAYDFSMQQWWRMCITMTS